jgi:alkylation response protein AidB-like acyl-CoA dehydrogenase
LTVAIDLDDLLEAVAAGAAERERESRPPHDAVDLVRRAGLGALRVPAELGGGGASVRELFEVLIALAAADSNVAHILRTHYMFVEHRLTLLRPGVHDPWLERVVAGDLFGNASTEATGPVVGGATFATTIVPADGGGYVLNGTKYYSTGSLFCDWVSVVASAPDGDIVFATVPVDREGVTLEEDWDGIGQRLTGTGTTRLVDVAVAEEEIVRRFDPSVPVVTVEGAFVQLYLHAVMAGVLRSALADAAERARRRTRVFTHGSGETVAADPLVQQVVGRISSAAFAAEAIVLRAAESIEEATASIVDGVPDAALAERATFDAARAKVTVEDLAMRATSDLFEIGGASATQRVHDLDRHWRNARTLASHNPTIYKARAVGDHEINGAPPPPGWFF